RSRSCAVRWPEHGAASRIRRIGEALDGVRCPCQGNGQGNWQGIRQGQNALMHQIVARPKSQRLPPALNIVTLATFSASRSARALDPVLPHVAGEFGIPIATAASFAAGFAFTFAAIQPLIGAAADLFGKARLMIICLVVLGLANIVGSLATSF